MQMAFFGNLLKRFTRFKDAAAEARKRMNPFVQTSQDPLQVWENVGEIGDGAFGKVHRAVNKTDRREAALKQMLLESEEDMEDLMVEIDILVSCKHENIVELFEAYHFDNRLWLYLEYCSGGALDTIMHNLDRPLSETQIRHVGHFVLKALVFLHARRVIHRDLKAGNVLITADGLVKLADFGVSARNTDDKQRRDTFIGTPFWMAPEVIVCETIKDNPYDYRADVWSLGITFIELAEMNPPLHEMHPMRVLIKVQRADPPTLRSPKKWSPEFAAFLRRCLVKDPNQRATTAELLEDVFVKAMDDLKPIRQLIGELSAEVIETIEEGVNPDALNQSSISLGSLDKLDEKEDDRASRDSSAANASSPRLSPFKLAADRQAPPPFVPASPVVTRANQPSPFAEPPKPPISAPPAVRGAGVATANERASDSLLVATANQRASAAATVEASNGRLVEAKQDEPTKTPVTAANEKASDSLPEATANEKASESLPVATVNEKASESLPEATANEKASESLPEATANEKASAAAAVEASNGRLVEKQDEPTKTPVAAANEEACVAAQNGPIGAPAGDAPALVDASSPAVRADAVDGQRPVTGKPPPGPAVSPLSHRRPQVLPKPTVDVRRHVAQFEHLATRAAPPPPRRSVSAQAETAAPEPAPPVAVTSAPLVDSGELAEEVLNALIEEQLSSVTDLQSVAGVVFDAMKDEMEAQLEETQEASIMTTDIDSVVVNDNRAQPDANGNLAPVRVGSGFGTVSAHVGPDSGLQVRDNRMNGRAVEDGEAASSSASTSGSKEESGTDSTRRRRQSHFRTLTRVRKFVVDGEEVVTTTSRVIVEGKETQHQEEFNNRKQGIREMRLLQKQEQRQHRDLVLRSQAQKDELDVRLRQEEITLQRQYDSELDALMRQQKVQLERAEAEHTQEIRFSSRRIKTTQDREMRNFRDLLKQELKVVKQEVDVVPKDRRKDALRQRMEEKDLEHAERERDFLNNLSAQMSAEIDRMTVKHRHKLGQMENGFMRQRHKCRRKFEESRWEMQENHMHLRHQKARNQLEEYFHLKRTQTVHRQGVEKEHLNAMISKDREFLLATQAAEKKRFPKMLRNDKKTRMTLFRESLRVSGSRESMTADEEKEKIRAFEEQEQERVRFETERLMRKQSNKLAAMQLTHERLVRELEQLQAEKRKDLMDQETNKLREIDDAFRKSLMQFREALKLRRQDLEAELQEELRQQDEFYTQSDDGPNVQIRELPADGLSPVTDLDRVPVPPQLHG